MKFDFKDFAQISEGTVNLGDLTIFTGYQGAGKTLVCQLIKVILDEKYIASNLKKEGYYWKNSDDPDKDTKSFLDLYFGQSSVNLWTSKTEIRVDEKLKKIPEGISEEGVSTEERVIYFPAQRANIFQRGWPKSFSTYDFPFPFVLANYSEQIRTIFERLPSEVSLIFNSPGLSDGTKELVKEAVYERAEINLMKSSNQKQIILLVNEVPIKYTSWSTGQQEFLTLLLYCNDLANRKSSSKKEKEILIIEEPELGLHPKAIIAFVSIIIDLIVLGYKVIISTHSQVILEAAWAIKELKGSSNDKSKYLQKILDIKATSGENLNNFFRKEMSIQSYFFNKDRGESIIDMSSLDVTSENENISSWGDLLSFNERLVDLVAESVAQNSDK